MKGWKNIIYLSILLGMMLYAVPQLQIGGGLTLPTIFGAVWIAMALLIIASHLHELLGVDEETRKQLARVRHLKRWQLEQRLAGRTKLMQLKK